MLTQNELPLRVIGQNAYFDFLGPQDEPWVSGLLAEMHRFEGQRRRQLAEHLAGPLPFEAPLFKRRAASRVLLRLWKPQRLLGPRSALVRELVFVAAAAQVEKHEAMASAAQQLGVNLQTLEDLLFGDLPAERIVTAPSPCPTANEILLRTNLAIAQAALMRAASVDLIITGATRPIVRLAKLRGLLCVISHADEGASPCLEISGPYSLFRHTLLYGRALAELLPHLAWCARFKLAARCALRGRLCEINLDNSAPIFPARPPLPFDSKLEQRFAKDIATLALDWNLVREPEPLRADGTLIFPDFLLIHRLHPERRVFIELIGFWTAEYLAKKFRRLQDAGVSNIILCVDQTRICADQSLPAGLPVVPFRRWVNAAEVLKLVEKMTGTGRFGPLA